MEGTTRLERRNPTIRELHFATLLAVEGSMWVAIWLGSGAIRRDSKKRADTDITII